MKNITVKKVGVGSVGKIVGVAQATIAFFVGLLATVLVSAGTISEGSGFVQSLGVSIVYLGLGVIIYPIIAFFVGWLQGAVAALIINFVFAESDGLKLSVEEDGKK